MFFQGLAAGAGALTLSHALGTRAGPYGSLTPDPEGRFDLPSGFSYRILETEGDPMDDGRTVPRRPDGMACFVDPDDGAQLILMRNHENRAPNGGVTRLVVSANDATRVSSNLVLSGTDRNCAGGAFAGRGWLTCEESRDDGHGYVFLCDLRASSVQEANRIDGYGRFNHEAVAIDPRTNVAYLTEDETVSRLYRFVPDAKESPFEGKLQALAVVGEAGFDTSNMSTGDSVQVAWVDIESPLAGAGVVAAEAGEKGAARIVRGEGISFFDGEVYVCSTSGGSGYGQIFALSDGGAQGTLRCLFTSTDPSALRAPDNIEVAPSGDVFMAEDNTGYCLVRGLTPTGEVFDLVRNNTIASEFAGICFSPDGRFAFVNAQRLGVTLVIYKDDGSAAFAAPKMTLTDAGVAEAGLPDAGRPAASRADAAVTDAKTPDAVVVAPDSGTALPRHASDDGCAVGGSAKPLLAVAATAATIAASRKDNSVG